MAPSIRSITTLLSYAAVSSFLDPFSLATNVARKTPSGLRDRLTAPLIKSSNDVVAVTGLVLADRSSEAREKLSVCRGGFLTPLRDSVALAARLDDELRFAPARKRLQWATGSFAPARGRGLLAAIYRDEMEVLKGNRWPDTTPTNGNRWSQNHNGSETGNRYCPLFVLTNSFPYSTAGYAQRSQHLLDAVARVGAQDQGVRASVPVNALTRYGYPAIIGTLDSQEKRIDNVVYHRCIPELYHPLLSKRLEAYTDAIVAKALEIGATVIHSTTDFENGIAARAAARRLGIPWVYEMRGEREKTWVASLPPSWRARALKSERFEALMQLEAQLAEDACRVVVLSETQKASLQARGVSSPVDVAFNGVNERLLQETVGKEESRIGLGWDQGKFIVGTITSVVDYEGLSVLVEVARRLKESNPDIHFVVVGDGPALPELQAEAQRLGLKNIRFLGRVPVAEVDAYYEAMDLFCIPRIDTEVTRVVTPLKGIPALAKGVPVLVSDLPALVETVPPDMGLVVGQGADAWAEAIVNQSKKSGHVREHQAVIYRKFANGRTWEAAGELVLKIHGCL
ncbi:glycosyltransferase [Corynebacterium aquilae]|uniref:glycosyltransferase n=1 Tax=Corynebacterium aquilae TaxID=203263 RepID=UPI0009FB9EFD|nr:glycosyltransferase [Corynebacterium aquilae]